MILVNILVIFTFIESRKTSKVLFQVQRFIQRTITAWGVSCNTLCESLYCLEFKYVKYVSIL